MENRTYRNGRKNDKTVEGKKKNRREWINQYFSLISSQFFFFLSLFFYICNRIFVKAEYPGDAWFASEIFIARPRFAYFNVFPVLALLFAENPRLGKMMTPRRDNEMKSLAIGKLSVHSRANIWNTIFSCRWFNLEFAGTAFYKGGK